MFSSFFSPLRIFFIHEFSIVMRQQHWKDTLC
jgi:hypothetical protein